MVIWGGIFRVVLIGVALLSLPAAGFLLVLHLKISPIDNTSQYNTQKNEISTRQIKKRTKSISGLSFDLDFFLFQ
jgi:hypothetical protein